MAPPRGVNPLTASSGRRGYLLYQYGSHFWVPIIDTDWSRGIIRDVSRVAIPPGGVYDATDFLLHQPGLAQKRGGTSYAGPALTGATYVTALEHVPFSGGAQLLAVGDNAHLFKVTAGATTDIGALNAASYSKPIFSPGATYLIIPEGSSNAQKYDGTTISTLGSGYHLNHVATYKSRLLGSLNATQNQIDFSPTPDVNSAWDTTNSFIDADNPIAGFATLNNAILIFSGDGIERIIGATPPPNSDMDRAPVSAIGCTDARSITVAEGIVFFANPQGVYMTNGTEPVSLTDAGQIGTYWRSLFSGYVTAAPVPSASTWTIATGWFRGFLFVSVLDASRTLIDTLMCNVARRAWWRLTNIKATCYAQSVDGTELYYGDASTNRVVAMSGIFSPSASNKNDANGTAVTPTIEFRAMGDGTGVKQFGFGQLTLDMRDAATDNPTMAVTVKSGIEADTSTTPAESPLTETTTAARKRFSTCKSAQSVTIRLAQTNASSKTEIYALEVEERSHSDSASGIS